MRASDAHHSAPLAPRTARQGGSTLRPYFFGLRDAAVNHKHNPPVTL